MKLRKHLIFLILLSLVCPVSSSGAKPKVIHVVTGAHQDIAFKTSYQESMNIYDEQLRKHIELIETDPALRFSMGNTYNIKDFLKRNPDFKPRLRYLMETGRISGPAQWVGGEPEWYTGEFLARYVAYSKYWLMSEMKHTPHWGQLNDMLSWTPQLAQILNKSGVDLVQVNPTRIGNYYLPEETPSYFVGLDGSKVIIYNTDYDGLVNFSDQDKSQPFRYIKHFGPYRHMLMSVIGDTGTEADRTKRLMDHIKWWNRKQAPKTGVRLELNTYEEAVPYIKEEALRVPPRKYSGLAYIWPWAGPWNVPSMFYHAQTEYNLPTAESLLAMEELLGIAPYPEERINQAWEDIFWTIDHNWGSDEREKVTSNRQAYKVSQELLNRGLTLLSENVKSPSMGTPLLVYNPLNWERSGPVLVNIPDFPKKRMEVVDWRGSPVSSQPVTVFKEVPLDGKGRCRVGPEGKEKKQVLLLWAEKVPALGYKRFYFRPKGRRKISSSLKVSKKSIENRFFRITIDPKHKTFSIYDKSTDRELANAKRSGGMERINSYYWTMDKKKKGKLRSQMKIERVTCTEQGPVRAVVEVEGIVSETIKVIQRFQLYGSSSILVQEISLEIPNYKPTNIKQALYYIFNLNNSSKPTMGIPFGAVPLIFQGGRARKIKFSRRSPGKSFKFGRKKKRPFGGEVYDLQKWINFDSGGHSIDLLSGRTQTRVYVKRGFAAVEIQGMINGHPDVLRFGIYSHASDWRKGNTPRRAWEFAHPMLGVATQEGKKGKALPEEACFLEVKSTNNTGNIIVSSLKRSFDGKGLALRFFETSDQDVTVKIKPVFKIPQAEVSRTNMVEQPFEPLNKTAGSYYVPIKGFGIETVKFYKQAVTDRKAPGRIKELSVTQTSSTGISLSWSASGDDGYEGKSSKYELRYSKRPINNHNWEQATLVKGLSPPRPAGEKEHFTVKGLKSSKTYYFAVKAIDESGNSSKLSKIISIVTESRDYIKPGRIVNLGVSKRASTSITLHWTASGDDGRRGKASRYDVLYSKESFDDTTWKRKAIAATGKIVPRKSGKPESFQVTGLQPTTKYYFSMVSYDEADNRSPLSNLTFSRTTSSITRAFQKGISPTVSYSGCSDTYLSKINEEELISIYGKETSLQTYSNNLSVILIRFDLSSIPTDAVVFKAILKLHAYDITYEDKGYLTCYRLKSDWNEEKGSGKTPDGKKSWKHGLEGSIDRQADYGLLPRGTVARVKTEDGKHWVKLDITPLVKDWVSKKQPNYGILLKGNCGGDCGMYFHSSDYEEDIKLRPRLEVSY